MIKCFMVLALAFGGTPPEESPGKPPPKPEKEDPAPVPGKQETPPEKEPPAVDVPDLLKKIADAYKEIGRMEVPFTQEKHVAILKKPIISSGKLVWNTDRLLYRAAKPALNETLITPEEIRVWIPETEQVEAFSRKRFRILETLDLGAGRNIEGLQEHYDIESISGEEETAESPPRLRLVPRDEKVRKYLTELRLQINRESSFIERIETTDSAGDRTVILLETEKMKTNDDVEEAPPELSAPEGTPVVRPLDPGADS